MVEVFKTNVVKQTHAKVLLEVLEQQFPHFRINFDLDDCDRILRVEGKTVSPPEIIATLNSLGCYCQVLP